MFVVGGGILHGDFFDSVRTWYNVAKRRCGAVSYAGGVVLQGESEGVVSLGEVSLGEVLLEVILQGSFSFRGKKGKKG